MPITEQLIRGLRDGTYDETLKGLYALDGREESLTAARERAIHTAEAFREAFTGAGEAGLFTGPGRTEIGGNHTDHQHGHVLCGSVDLDMLCCAAPNKDGIVRVWSEGYAPFELDLKELEPVPAEEGTSKALTRGVAAGIAELGYPLCGFDAYMTSNVLSGSGLSSSAAYEILVGNVWNALCCGGALDAVTLAKIGQRAENVYFGKPCGLMDQMGSSVGGAVSIDFKDPADPTFRPLDYDFTRSGHALCIVDTVSSHDDLTADYAAIPQEMKLVAEQFGKAYLREVDEEEFRRRIPELRKTCGDRAVLRAMHYFRDDRMAREEAEALEGGDFDSFLKLVRASGESSETRLENIWSPAAPQNQAVAVALAVARDLLGEAGAVRVHGGGFAGTIQAFVPTDRVEEFRAGMEGLLGPGTCHILHIRPMGGGVVVAP